MARKAFYSFHFDGDHWRASQVRQIGAIEGNAELSDNDWEAVKRKGDGAIEAWIDGQLSGRSCVIVLVGAHTAGRKWIKYEIRKAWELSKGVVGIRIHKLLNSKGDASSAGANPFAEFKVGDKALSTIVALYDPPGADSKAVYKSIADNIGGLVESAITTRSNY
jgi:MTH538 TIR-like domain (DUF1863)